MEEQVNRSFNVRVYGIVQQGVQILLSDEHEYGRKMPKFIGGGLEFGEGTIECLEREFREETGLQANVLSHFYTTDFFQRSYFKGYQLISIYYRVQIDATSIQTVSTPFENVVAPGQCFRWASLKTLREEDFTFPVDRKVLKMLQQEMG